MEKLELDIGRIKHIRMKSNSLKSQRSGGIGLSGLQAALQNGRQLESRRGEVRKEGRTGNLCREDGQGENFEILPQHSAMVRRNSWAEEVEQEGAERVEEVDPLECDREGMEGSSGRSDWADGLMEDVREVAGRSKMNRPRRADRDVRKEMRREADSRRREKEHECERVAPRHWFGESEGESGSEESSGEEEGVEYHWQGGEEKGEDEEEETKEGGEEGGGCEEGKKYG